MGVINTFNFQARIQNPLASRCASVGYNQGFLILASELHDLGQVLSFLSLCFLI